MMTQIVEHFRCCCKVEHSLLVSILPKMIFVSLINTNLDNYVWQWAPNNNKRPKLSYDLSCFIFSYIITHLFFKQHICSIDERPLFLPVASFLNDLHRFSRGSLVGYALHPIYRPYFNKFYIKITTESNNFQEKNVPKLTFPAKSRKCTFRHWQVCENVPHTHSKVSDVAHAKQSQKKLVSTNLPLLIQFYFIFLIGKVQVNKSLVAQEHPWVEFLPDSLPMDPKSSISIPTDLPFFP